MPSVSVVIPTYNSERSIEISPKSLINQSYKNVEIILVDRFSENRAAEIAEKYGAKVYQLDCEGA